MPLSPPRDQLVDVADEQAASRTGIVDALLIVMLDQVVAVCVVNRPKVAGRTLVGTIRTVVAHALKMHRQDVAEVRAVLTIFYQLEEARYSLRVRSLAQ